MVYKLINELWFYKETNWEVYFVHHIIYISLLESVFWNILFNAVW